MSKLREQPRVVGLVLAAIVLIVGLGITGYYAFVNQINGGGGHSEKAAAMMDAADKAPESDWTLRSRQDPKVDQGCLSIDTTCLKLTVSWQVDHEVDPYEVAKRMGLNTEKTTGSALGESCVNFLMVDTGNAEICSPADSKEPGLYQVNIFMSQR